MRQIGSIPDPEDARRLGDHLLTLGITSRIDERPSGNLIWIHREEQVEAARQELKEFLENPNDPRYRRVAQTAKALRKQKEQEDRKHIRNSVALRGAWDYRPADRVPLTLLLVAASVVVGVFTELGSKPTALGRTLAIAPSEIVMLDEDEPAEMPGVGRTRLGGRAFLESEDLHRIREGQVWRLLTPIFLHFSIWHLVFNLFWLNDLGGMVEIRKGSIVFGALVLATAVLSNLAQYAQNGPRFGGMSGVVYGLFGYIWISNRYDSSAGLPMRPNTEIILGLGFLAGLAGFFGPVANTAHLVGFAVGLAFGLGSIGWKRLKRRIA